MTDVMAAGVLKLSNVEIWLGPNQSTAELYAENVGDSMLYLDVLQRLLRNPGERPEQLVPLQEIEQPTLLVAPLRLALGPGQRYLIQLRELQRPGTPQVWRVTFQPREKITIAGELTDGAAAPLSLSIGYGVLIYQMPDK
ncbi:hypothetical protein DBR37_11580 [Herminiimonas sp. KBW02]|nr:hypothetical protein DBR37_11580 [Herminiimonas sp. KBW02]